VVAQHADFPALEAIEEVTPRHCGRAAAASSVLTTGSEVILHVHQKAPARTGVFLLAASIGGLVIILVIFKV
jgi:hypothetical protein